MTKCLRHLAQFCKITPQHIEVELITLFSLNFAKKKYRVFERKVELEC